MTKRWNPRYVAYARHHRRTPECMLRWDKERFPGACMMGFILWINRKWHEWYEVNGLSRNHIKSEEDHKNFTRWLKPRRPIEQEVRPHGANRRTPGGGAERETPAGP